MELIFYLCAGFVAIVLVLDIALFVKTRLSIFTPPQAAIAGCIASMTAASLEIIRTSKGHVWEDDD